MNLKADIEPGASSGCVLAALGLAGHPKGLGVLFFAELWERFSYYGMRALLVLFMVAPAAEGGLGMAPAEAALVYGNYTMAVYLLSIPGGVAADTILGARAAVLLGGAMIAAGHFTLAIAHPWTLYAGLILVALGTGLFKPSISALVGGLYGASDARRDAGFSLFYMGINIGGFIAPLVTGFLAQSPAMKSWLSERGFDPIESWHWGFAAAGVGMVIGLLILALGRTLPQAVPDAPQRDERGEQTPNPILALAAVTGGTLALMALILLSDREGFEFLRWAYVLVPAAIAFWLSLSLEDEQRRYGAMFVLLIGAVIFWAIFEQAGVTIALFADQLTRSEIAGFAFPSAWFQSLNSLFVILLAPLFAALWMKLGERQPSSPVKFGLGLAFLALSFVLMVPASIQAAEGRVSPWWLVGLFFLQTVGEMLLSPVGLATMTRLAPARAVGLALGIWFLGAALGNKLAGVFATGFQSAEPQALAGSFLWQAGLAGFAALAFFALTPWIRGLMGSVR